MIIGNGLIGSAFKKCEEINSNVLIFASGVSSSSSNKPEDFKRENDLVLDTISKYKKSKFVYFSSILAGISDNDYYNHKVRMEELIKSKSKDYLIFKVPQIIGFNGNNTNLIKYITNNIKKNNRIKLFKGIDRALLDVDDMVNIVNYCINKVDSGTIYLSHIEKLNINDIVLHVSNNLGIKPIVDFVENKMVSNWTTPNSDIIEMAINDLGITRKNYTNKIIKKYII